MNINEPKDWIIAHIIGHSTIPSDSYLFCGHCGNKMGKILGDITFPFSTKKLMANMKDIDFTVCHGGGIKHSCGHTLFKGGTECIFVDVKKYNIWNNKNKG